MRKNAFLFGAASWLLAMGLALPAAAQVPNSVTHQGRLLDDAGAPITGSAELLFSLHDAATGGSLVWSEQLTVDVGNDGFYAVELGGDSNPLTQTVLSGNVWLELSVNGNALSPRLAVNSVPFAISAGQAASVAPGSITTESIAAGAVTSTQLSNVPWQKLSNLPSGLDDGDNDTLGGLSCATGNVAIFDGTNWGCSAPPASYTDNDAVAALDLEIVQHDDSRLQYLPAVTTDCNAGTGLWCNAPNAWGSNRFSTTGRYTQCSAPNDCSGNTLTLSLDNNQHKSVMLSHLDWTSSGSIDVHISTNGGGNYTFSKRLVTLRETAQTPYLSTIRTIASNLPIGANVRVRLTARQGRIHFEGFALSKQVLPESKNEQGRNWAIVRNMGDFRNTDTAWVDVPGRTVTYAKQSSASPIKISYQDTVGYVMTGGHEWSCRWRLLMDGNPVGREQWHHSGQATGWRIDSKTMTWFIPGGVAAGSHTFKLQSIRNPAAAGQCLNGWAGGQQQNFFLVEEMLP
jgi:hypothetical protein